MRLRILTAICLLAAALFLAAAPVRAFEGKGIGLLAAFNDGIYWQDPAAAEDAETTCSGDGPAAAPVATIDSGVQSVMATPPDASGPFGPGGMMRKVYISIVIDDVGLDQKRSARAIGLPAGVTLAFLPYAGNIQAQAAEAAGKGHELMVHLPMEPSRMTADPGPDYLGVEHTAAELEKRIARNLDAFGGYKGVNNHMGSAFTQHRAGLEVLMRALKKRDIYFLDSKTAQGSIAEDMARAKGIPVTHRDVFIDHFETAEQVRAALEKTERIARITGYAVAIGHPKDVTLDALEAWLPTLPAKGIELIPLSEMIEKRAHKSYSAAAFKPAGLND